FVGLSMPELVDEMALPDDVWPRKFQQALADLAPLPVEERVARLAQLLPSRLEPRRELQPQIREAVRLIRQMRGRVRVEGRPSEPPRGTSQREPTSKTRSGPPPNPSARQIRVAAVAADATRNGPPAWALLAANYGYADQAHLAREFRDLTGLAPTELLG